MAPSEISIFGVTLFLALTALLIWKRRRDLVQVRMNEKLRGYMAVQDNRDDDDVEEVGESLVRVA